MKIIAFWFALIAAILATYWPALHGAFIWDDIDLIRLNPLVTAPAGLRLIWTTKEAVDFWPLTNSLFWVEWKIWGETPLAFHLVNVALHVLNCFLLHGILKRLAVPFTLAIVALFALHPMNVEAVAWIFQTKTLLSTSFVLASALAFLGGRSIVSVGSFAAALLSKVSVVMWPVVLALFVFTTTRSLRTTMKRTAPFFVLSFVVGVINLTWYPYEELSPADAIHFLSGFERVLLVGHTTLFYVVKALVPYPVSFIYPKWDIAIDDVVAWLPLVAMTALAAVALGKKSWRTSALVLSFVGFWILLFPALGLFTIYYQRYSWVADHWIYSALPLFIVAAVNVIGTRVPRKVGAIVLMGVLTGYAYLTFDHASDFEGPEKIWSHAIEDNDRAFLAYNNLGHIQYEANRVAEAEASFKRSLEVKPDYRDALLNLGRLYKNVGRFAEAEALYRKGIEVSPKFVSTYVNLGSLYGTMGRLDEARVMFEKALSLDPDQAPVHYNLAAVYQSIDDRESTYRELGLANKISGLSAYKYGELARAKEFLTAAAQYLPNDAEVRSHLDLLASQ